MQTYYDRYGRESVPVDMQQKTFDLDYQYRFPVGERHNVICGAGYRQISDFFFGDFALSAIPEQRSTNLFSYFVQDEITLVEDRWYLTAGSKFLHNDFTGFEFQPSVRLLWTPSDRQSVWASVSRAVQTPDRLDENMVFNQLVSPFGPVYGQLRGNPAFESENLLAYEFGYRAQPRDDLYWDLATFYNQYDDLTGTVPTGAPVFDPSIPAFIVPLTLANLYTADTYGGELACTLDMREDWRITGSYSYSVHRYARTIDRCHTGFEPAQSSLRPVVVGSQSRLAV